MKILHDEYICMVILYENIAWMKHMKILYEDFVWNIIWRIHMYGDFISKYSLYETYEDFIWKFCMKFYMTNTYVWW